MKPLATILVSVCAVLFVVGASPVGAGSATAPAAIESAEAALQAKIDDLERETGEHWFASIDTERGRVAALSGRYAPGIPLDDPAQAQVLVERFIADHSELFGVEIGDLRATRAEANADTRRARVVFQQYYRGIPVEGGVIQVFFREEDQRLMIRNSCRPGIAVSTSPAIPQEQAIAIARLSAPVSPEPNEIPDVDLIILPLGEESDSNCLLAWKVHFDRFTHYIDAQTGVTLQQLDNYRRDVVHSGTIRGTTYPLLNPGGGAEETPLEFVYVWLDEVDPTGHNFDDETDAAGAYEVRLEALAGTFTTCLQSNITAVHNGAGNDLWDHHVYFDNPHHDYTFPGSPGEQANVYDKLVYGWNRTDAIFHHSQPLVPAVANDTTLHGDYGSSNGTRVRFSPNAGRYACVVEHEFAHCVVFDVNGGWVTAGGDSVCMDEALATYMPCAFNEDPHFRDPSGVWDLSTNVGDMFVQDQDGDGDLTEKDHAYYWSCNPVAGAWWDLRGALGVDAFHELFWDALGTLVPPPTDQLPRDFFNELLWHDDDDGDPRNGTPHVDQIDAAYRRHGMNYWPKVFACNLAGVETNEFKPGDTIYCRGTGLPTNHRLRLYVTANDDDWDDGDALRDLSGDGFNTVVTDENGNLPRTMVMRRQDGTTGLFDIIADVDRNGRYDCDFIDIIDASDNVAQIGFAVGARADIALITDCSTTMGDDGKLDQAKNAGKWFVDALHVGDQIALVSFAEEAMVLAPLTYVDNADPASPLKQGLKEAINGMVAGGLTNFGAGLDAAFQELSRSPLGKKYAVFLSDGGNTFGTYDAEVAAFRAKGWPVFTVGLGENANTPLLKWIAQQTGGKYFPARNTDLQALYDRIQVLIHGDGLLATMQNWINPGQVVTDEFSVPASLDELCCAFFWPDGELDVALVASDGRLISPETAVDDPDVTCLEGETYACFTIANPTPGGWVARVTAVDIAETGSEFSVNLAVPGPVASSFIGVQPVYEPGEAVLAGVLLGDAAAEMAPLLGATVTGRMIRADGTVAEATWNDDGAAGDETAGDGIYSGVFDPTTARGAYALEVTAQGEGSEGPVDVEMHCTVQVGGFGQSGFRAASLKPVPGTTIEEPYPEVRAALTGCAKQIDPSSIELRVDGAVVAHVYDALAQTISYVPLAVLSEGTHTVSVSASEPGGAPIPAAAWCFNVGMSQDVPDADAVALGFHRIAPTSGGTVVQFGLPREGAVDLRVFDVTGAVIRVLEEGTLPSGLHAVDWNRRDDSGRAVPSGVYFVRLSFGGNAMARKTLVVR